VIAWDQEVVLLLPLPLIGLANLAELRRWPALATFNSLLLYTLPALLAFYGLLAIAAGASAAGLALLVAAVPVLVVQLPPVLEQLGRLLPLDPASQLDRLALVLTVAVVGSQLGTQLTTDVLAQASSGQALSAADLVLQELPFLLAALLGVGLWLRRPLPAAARRLGWVRPTWWQVALALAAAGAFFAFASGMDWLAARLTPALAEKVNGATGRLFGQLDNPVGIATIALAAGICEEALFRGALQPRLGLWWTALVFTSVHTEYGLSLDALAVLVLACGLGAIRKFTNTTTSTLSHVSYNALVGAGVAGAAVVPAIAIEAALCLLLFGCAVRRWRSRPASDPVPAS
jgi:membrane protease YdiL (CAAX protease family)